MLPLAAAAGSKMGTKRLNPVFGIFMKSDGFAFHKGAFSPVDADIYQVTGGCILYKNHLSLMMCHTFPFRRYSFNPQVGDYLIFHLSGHGRKNKGLDRKIGQMKINIQTEKPFKSKVAAGAFIFPKTSGPIAGLQVEFLSLTFQICTYEFKR